MAHKKGLSARFEDWLIGQSPFDENKNRTLFNRLSQRAQEIEPGVIIFNRRELESNPNALEVVKSKLPEGVKDKYAKLPLTGSFLTIHDKHYGGHSLISSTSADILAHEVGHLEQSRKWLKNNKIAGILQAAGYMSPIAGMAVTHEIRRRGAGLLKSSLLGLGTAALMSAPLLYMEGDASRRGYKWLKRQPDVTGGELKRAKSNYLRAWGSYAVPTAGVATAGVGGYALYDILKSRRILSKIGKII